MTKWAIPDPDCALCPRLSAFIQKNRDLYPDFFNAPVPSFGDEPENVQLLIVGLAPGLRGANRTGRPFTGDYAGDLLYETLARHKFAEGIYDKSPDDGLALKDCRITNAVKCVPPENKVTGAEIKTCNQYLASEFEHLPNLKCILALGGVAHGAVLTTFGEKKSAHKFGHNVTHDLAGDLAGGLTLVNSYHCSRYNTNTGRLTEQMFDDVFVTIRGLIGG
ncbi:MAG: uracil-DNA glycosylase [Rhodospirillales bacterium]|jgi:uracil-DNA glycosylase|nr:uracil-DNA glycosylase [Rhodospirillales bacterium]MBT4041681.1 uracil-DNA glycosylase [Rhodospirillales bacterium]MBT4626385.1 uracil-DNA glycosylase [Rhodospirillales bacterium]MBT5350127.1 uracil-DNA glycosylase [Rhodospirillales bacterium]MBT5520359.1 uracil-DNA glycosylase [Rhodospirillales bacterium]